MKAKQDHLIRMACRIYQQLCRPIPVPRVDWDRAADELLHRLQNLQRHRRLSAEAARRGWCAAAAAEQARFLTEASRVEGAVTHLLYQRPPIPSVSSQSNLPQLATILAELRQLNEEFEDSTINLKNWIVSVRTDRIVLKEIDLGPFSIQLNIDRLGDLFSSDCFQCIALEPNPAARYEETVHPHIQADRLCAGDAATPISVALSEGRIADAFILIRSVLQTYNSYSPYVAMENWRGQSCGECGDVTDEDHLYFCDRCQKEMCEDCYSSCDICGHGACLSCMQLDESSGNRCCSACLRACHQCNRLVDEDHFDEESECCPGCLAVQQTQQELLYDHESTPSPGIPATTSTPAAA